MFDEPTRTLRRVPGLNERLTRALLGLALFLVAVPAPAQVATNAAETTATNATPVLARDSNEKAWSVSLAAYTYFAPGESAYVQPTVTADRGWLHLEARYNYEDLETGSAWVGYNFGGGEKLAWEFTPMLGGVFGDTMGVAPGYRGSLGWWKLELYSEGEYVFDTGHSSDSFFYNWSELTLSPLEWFRLGMVTQRTRAYESDREIQRGVLVGFTYRGVDLSGYMFNPDDDKPTYVVAVTLNF